MRKASQVGDVFFVHRQGFAPRENDARALARVSNEATDYAEFQLSTDVVSGNSRINNSGNSGCE
jgi:hypothetical protein